jgi:DNA primase
MTGEKVRAARITVELSNPRKVLFPEDGITKGDLVACYRAVAAATCDLSRL